MATANTTWADCQRFTETFKTLGNHQIKADILLPPSLKPGRHPLIIAYHGGYLISGARDFYMFMASWVPAYAKSTSAIIVSPDYRLLPSASTTDILEDAEDLWKWVHDSFPAALSKHAPGHEVDLDKVLVEGNSAGGFLAAHLAMNHLTAIRAAIMVYPMLDCLDPYLTDGPPRELPAPFPLIKGQSLRDKIEQLRTAGWASERRDQGDIVFTLSAVRDGEFGGMFGTDTQYNPLHRVKESSAKLPRMWILHGKDDTGVRAQGSIEFADEMQKSRPSSEVILDVVSDEPSEHGFDQTWTMNDEKLTRRLDWISTAWLT